MRLTGEQVRQACELLRWSRYDLQRGTALPFVVIDRALNSRGPIEGTLADEIILKEAFHRGGVEPTPNGGARLRSGEG